MNDVWIGESVELQFEVVDELPDGYTLPDASSITCRLGPLGSSVASVAVTASSVDSDIVTVPLTALVTAEMASGEWSALLLDTTGPVLGTFSVQVRALMAAPGTTEPDSGLTYADYLAAGHRILDVEDFETYRVDAAYLISDITLGADSSEHTDAVRTATFRAADALFLAATQMASERMGSYSYSVTDPKTAKHAREIILRALSGTGLTYRGITP